MMVPLFHHAARSFAQGEYPFWMETVMGGLPLYDSPMFSAEYPFYLLRLPLFSDPVAGMWAVHWLILLHLVILAANSFVMLRCLGLTAFPAAFGAALLATCPNSFDYAEWVNVIAPYSWFPLVVAGMVLALDPVRGRSGILLGGVALGLLCLASPAQPLLHAVVVGAALFVHAVLRRARAGRGAEVPGMAARFAAMGALGFVLGSPALVPAVLAMKDSVRFNGEFPPILGGDPVPLDHSLHGQLTPAELAGTLLPVEVTRLNGHSFIGLGAGLFACLGLARVGRHRHALPLALLGAYGLLSATGTHLGFAYLNHVLPLMDRFRQPQRHLFLFVLSAAVLAGFGLQHVLAARRLTDQRTLALAAVFFALAALSFGAPLAWLDLGAAVVIGTGGLLGAALVVAARRRGRRAGAVAGAIVIVAASFWYPTRIPALEDGDTFGPTNVRMHAVLRDLAKLPDLGSYRLVFLDPDDSQFWSMNGSYYGFRTVQAYMNPLPFRQWDEVFQRFHLRHYYPLLGARYVLCKPPCDAAMLQDYRPLRSLDRYSLLETDSAQPLYSVFGRVAGFYNNAEEFYSLVDGGGDIRAAVLVDAGGEDGRRVAAWLGAGGVPEASVQQLQRTPNRLRVRVRSDRRAVLVVNQYHRPAWRASRDGAAVPVLRLNLNQLGVLVGAGVSEVELSYQPLLFVWLLWLERGTMLALMGALAWQAWARRRRQT